MRNYFLLALSFLMLSCGNASPKASESASSVVIDMPIADSVVTKYDTIALGKIIEGEIVKSSFEVCNISAKPLVIVNVITGCGCTSINYDSSPIMPSDKRMFEFEFNSQGRVGWQIKAIELIDANHNVGRVFMSAEVSAK